MLPHEVAELEEARLALAMTEIADEHLRIGSGVAAFDASPETWMNLVVGVAMDGPVDDTALDRILVFYEERGVEPKIQVCPFADLSLAHGMGARGFALSNFETVLFRTLDGAATELPDDVELLEVDPGDDAAVEVFVDAHVACFAPEGGDAAESMALSARRMVAHPRVRTWTVVVDGQLAGSGALELRPPIATLIGAGTLPRFRGRGLQQALIGHRCRLAHEAGCNVATIGSRPQSPTGRNALRLGFATAYTKAVLTRSNG